MMAGMILISFFLLGAAFITLSYQYTVQDKRESMEDNAGFIAEFTGQLLRDTRSSNSIYSEAYRLYVSAVAKISNATIIICTNTGEVVYSSNGQQENALYGKTMPAVAVGQVNSIGAYNGLTDLGGQYAEKQFLTGTPIYSNAIQDGTQAGIVFMAAEVSSITELWRAFSSIFFFTAVVVLCLAFITTSLTSLKQTKPLKEIAEAARKFGHGEFEARAVGYETRQDEVGELAEAFNAMADSICKSETRRSEFVANISHELKTPMTTIAGFTDGILDGTIPREREREALTTISLETRRLSRLVRRMLDLSRLQSAESVTAQEQFDVSEVLLRVLVSLETKINSRHLDVDTALPDGSVQVWGDPDSITQVCYNLLDNAIKFAAEGTTLGLSVATKGGKALVSVRNSGEPISPEELPMIFDRFHKTDHSRSVDREGVGLGLYIVKTILNNHKEDITVTSEHGVTEFTFTLTLV